MKIFAIGVALAAAPFAAVSAQPSAAQMAQPDGPTYADLAALAASAQLVIRAEIRNQAVVKPERAPGLAPGYARLYVTARTQALVSGRVPVGEELTYLADVPLNADGKVPRLRRLPVILFANPVANKPGSIQLVASSGQLQHTPALEARIRPILAELAQGDVPPVVTGVRDAFSVRGNLAGETETQIFLDTEGGTPASISVLRRPGRAPVWGVSWGEIIDAAALPPEPQTIGWFRLACSLPEQLPAAALYSEDSGMRRQAAADYILVKQSLGPCERRLPAI
ncbi:hypothetical protein [Altererythrobacter sp. GH1-8]|uniref:hypothetical protein n=1 Tax=Altererythrobacter sp. GH1-8 TaxID=3349333 RepID=UPI00374DDA45